MGRRPPLRPDQAAAIVSAFRVLGELSRGLFDMVNSGQGLSDPFRDAASSALVPVAALDEYSWLDDSYENRRDMDEFGRIVPGLRLVRDGLTHKRGLPMAKEVTSFFAPPGTDAVFYVAESGPVWPPASELEEPPEARRTRRYERQLQTYKEHLVGMGVQTAVTRAFNWFEAEYKREGTIINEARNTDAVDLREYNFWHE